MSEGVASRALRPAEREARDVSAGFVVKLLAFIGLALLLLLLLAYWIFPGELQDRRFAQPFPAFPAPQLQPSPRADMAAFHAREMHRLNGIGWADKDTGKAHIPIGQAMRDIAAHGIPGWPAGRTDVSGGARR